MSAPVELVGESVAYVLARFTAGQLRQEYRATYCENESEDTAPCYLDPPDCKDEKCDGCKQREIIFRRYITARDEAARLWMRLQRHLVRLGEKEATQ